MSIIRWDPIRDINDFFERYSKTAGTPRKGNQELVAQGDWAPRVDIAETETAFNIKAEIPGVQKEDVKITVDKGVLTIRGERKKEEEEKNKTFHRIERYYGLFTRSFTLPENVDESKIEASFKGGLLDLHIPKTEVQKPEALEIKLK